MNIESLTKIVELVEKLGAGSKEAFIWWLVVAEGLPLALGLCGIIAGLMVAWWILGVVRGVCAADDDRADRESLAIGALRRMAALADLGSGGAVERKFTELFERREEYSEALSRMRTAAGLGDGQLVQKEVDGVEALFMEMLEGRARDKTRKDDAEYIVMTLDETINHAASKAEDGTPCAKAHKQLELWLRELQELREVVAAMDREATERAARLVGK